MKPLILTLKLLPGARLFLQKGISVTSPFVSSVRAFGSCSSCGAVGQDRKPRGLLRKTFLCSSVTSYFAQSSHIASSSVSSSVVPHANADAENVKWDLYAGVVVERRPVITPRKDAMQEKYFKYLTQVEFENSKKSDHEMRHQNDKKMLEQVKAGEIDAGNVQTARDDEDRWAVEAQGFKPASRETEADLKNDIKSLERALDSHLLLVVEQKLGSDYRWICPHAKLEQGETLRIAAERMMLEIFPDLKTRVLGHAPWGFYKYKYPKDTANSVGAKVFDLIIQQLYYN
ncbi:39S ribosomal protein L46, mitochondrial [Orchesella cincta]|uniref:39S ribosomal protein L46, mitochondrial n=1 Tax=Orchesella cincta TaxID=48709 RepID=A0A1D2N958_ORCCI|nr:39S ribosomal protein L46, mitochondrial [Orchesella cincta]